MNHNKLGLTIGAVGGAACVLANVGSFAAPIANRVSYPKDAQPLKP